MDERIGIGIIVGLMFASSMFVYNFDRFSKAQKTVLLIFVVFPPLQWASILVLLGIDYFKEQSLIQSVSSKETQAEPTNFQDKINTLKELKNKELLTEDEYNKKADTLKRIELETELKLSNDYRKLKSLFDDNILTKEEFEQKLQILSERSHNLTNKQPKIKLPDLHYIKDGYNFKMGSFKEFNLRLSSGRLFCVYQKISNGKYFIYLNDEIMLFANKETCLKFVSEQIS